MLGRSESATGGSLIGSVPAQGRENLVLSGGDALAGLAADDVAEGVLETLGVAVGGEPQLCLRLLGGSPLGIAPARPGGAGLAEAAGAVDRDREDEEADRAVHDPLLEEADCDQAEEERGAD